MPDVLVNGLSPVLLLETSVKSAGCGNFPVSWRAGGLLRARTLGCGICLICSAARASQLESDPRGRLAVFSILPGARQACSFFEITKQLQGVLAFPAVERVPSKGRASA